MKFALLMKSIEMQIKLAVTQFHQMSQFVANGDHMISVEFAVIEHTKQDHHFW